MVSFKNCNNSITSEQGTPNRLRTGTLRNSVEARKYLQPRAILQHRDEPSLRDRAASSPSENLSSTSSQLHPIHCRLDQPVTSLTPEMDNKKVVQGGVQPSPMVQMRRKSAGQGIDGLSGVGGSGIRRRSGPQGLRSPAAKRPLSAPVALQGWLHKQGSEGLMLWKKRWFVLSEYCLFYYKGPEEEKLLGSILLPSYRVTACRPEDKANKKFAFKAEHANMRTYLFAAESRESMNQWVGALTLATLLQDPNPGGGDLAIALELGGVHVDGDRSGRPSVSSISSILNQSADDSDSGFHGFQSRDDPSHASNNNSSPNSANTASFPTLNNNNNNNVNHETLQQQQQPSQPVVNGWMIQSPQYGQQQPSTSAQQQQYSQILPGPSHQHHQPQIHQHVLQKQQNNNVQTVQPVARNFGQPLYANAPPKPRRLTEGSNEYSTPSPDLDSIINESHRLASKSPGTEYERGGSVVYVTRMTQNPHQQQQQTLRTDKSGLNYGYVQSQQQPNERRTPDTYGRSAKPRNSRGNGDYEDVYGAPQLYQRPAGPVGYTKGPAPAPIPIPVYNQQHQTQQHQQIYAVLPNHGAPVMRQPRIVPPPRPRSADFLEYEAARRPQQQNYIQSIPSPGHHGVITQRRTQRPKSSLDVINPTDVIVNDGYFYSEERYAAQMRQSAVYLHQTPQHHQQQRNQSLSRAATPSKPATNRDRDLESSLVGSLSETSSNPLRRSQREQNRNEQQQQQHLISTHSLQRHTEITSESLVRRSLRERTSFEQASGGNRELLLGGGSSGSGSGVVVVIPGEGATVPRRIQRDRGTEYDTSTGGRARRSNEQQFARSASARLPRTRHQVDRDEEDYAERSSGQDSRDGERKIQQREESMKRLLEWKQRMLQSPLTRKPAGSGSRGIAQNELSSYYKQQAFLELAAHEASIAEARHSRRRNEDGHRTHPRSKSTDGRRSVSVNVSRYNSYSSDDEELGNVRHKRIRRPSHAGRSPRQVLDERTSSTTTTTTTTTTNSAITSATSTSTTTAMITTHGFTEKSKSNASQKKNFENSTPPSINSSSPVEGGFPLITRCGIPSDGGYSEICFSEPPNDKLSTKKPAGILKQPILCQTGNQIFNERMGKTEPRLNTLAGYVPGENWNGQQKNVQWINRGDERLDDWDLKIDETKVVKEFSYQYIKPDDEDGRDVGSKIVKSRIKSFESSSIEENPGAFKEPLAMQEPLKVSPPQATEAHVSRLDPTRKTAAVIRDFALGESACVEDKGGDCETDAAIESNKSVKDLLADFERKSKIILSQENEKSLSDDQFKHRGVFSDTETLLYDTGSDFESMENFEDNDFLSRNFQGDDEDNSTGTIRRRKDFNDRRRNGNENSFGKSEDRQEASVTNFENENSEYARLSVTESLVTHDDEFNLETGAETIPREKETEDFNPEEHYMPMSPRKAILDPADERPNSKMMENLFASLDHEENSYVEMSQNGIGHSLLAPNNDARGKRDSGGYSSLDQPHYEFVCVADNKMEPVYMEVSQLGDRDEDNNDDKTAGKRNKKSKRDIDCLPPRPDLPDILTTLKSDSSDADDESSKDLDSLDAPRHPRFSLSDTFRPASYYLGASEALIAELRDSSDSELVSPPPIPTSLPPLDDLDSLELQDSFGEVKKVGPQVAASSRDSLNSRDSPRSWNKPAGQVESHRSPSRFSDTTISSTFRGSRISLESASGSDSVELRSPEEEARHRQLKRRPVSDDVCEVLDSLDELESLGSRFDGASIDLDRYLEELQARDAFNVDIYAKDLSYNSIYGLNEAMLVTDKHLRKTTSRDRISGKTNSLDQPFRYGATKKTSSASSLPSMRVSDLPPVHQHSQSFTGDVHYENVASFSPLRGSPAIRSELSNRRSSPLVSHSRESSYSACQQPGNAQSPDQSRINPHQQPRHSRETSQDSARFSLSPNHPSGSPMSHESGNNNQFVVNSQSHNNDQSGAPYYYSDLQASEEIANRNSVNQTRLLPQLNNQRGDSVAATGGNKRNDIGRMVNPIPRQMPRQIQVEDIDEARRIAAELRKSTTQYLAEKKAGLRVDQRNIYESDTLRRVKSNDPLPDLSTIPDPNSRNLYPHGIRDKTNEIPNSSSASGSYYPADNNAAARHAAAHRRSRSLEGLLDDVELQNLVEQRNRIERASASTSSEIREPVVNQEERFEGEDPWEEDTLWRESLRRVSLRHARSLDNLEASPSVSSTRNSQPRNTGNGARSRTRITRGATYVNDSVLVLRRDVEDPGRNRRKDIAPRESVNDTEEEEEEEEDDEQRVNPLPEDDETYERLAMDRIGAGGYIWDSENEAYRKTGQEANSRDNCENRHGNSANFLAEGNLHPPTTRNPEVRTSGGSGSTGTSGSFEIDREKLRQWDLLSSACLLQEQQQQQQQQQQQRNSMAESGRGLHLPTTTDRNRDGNLLTTDMKNATAMAMAMATANEGEINENATAEISTVAATASGSGSVIGRDPLPPRAISTSQLPQRTLTQQPPIPRGNPHQHQSHHPVHETTLPGQRPLERTAAAANANNSNSLPANVADVRITSSQGEGRIPASGSGQLIQQDQHQHQRHQQRKTAPRVISPNSAALRVSSPNESDSHSHSPIQITNGEKDYDGIGRVNHINGRPRQTTTSNSNRNQRDNRDNNEMMFLNKRARLAELDTPRRLENLQKLEELKKHLMDLEKQYEKGKPMVNLVDNMVKLGSLYNRGTTANGNQGVSGSRHDEEIQENNREVRDRLEFNQRVQEQRLLAEERRDWDRISPDHGQLQAKVQQLYKLDRLLQEESGTLHSLQQDKEILEKALGGLRNKLQGSRSNPAEVERYRKQQLLLERELSRVRLLLAHNSKKLEETVAENARLEQELVVLRQKLQASRRYANGNVTRDPSGTTAALEAELRRVQQLVGDLQRQRQELSIQVRQLTEKSHSLVQQIRPQHVHPPQVHHQKSKKRSHSSWLETDLDSGTTFDHGLDSPTSPLPTGSSNSRRNGSPRYKERGSSSTQHDNNTPYDHPVSHGQQQRTTNSPAISGQISAAISPQLREQIQQHQLKQQQLRDQMQGKGSPTVNNPQGPLYVNTENSRRQDVAAPLPPPEYLPPPPPPPPLEDSSMNGKDYGVNNEDSKFSGMMLQNREKQEIKTVRIVKRESERRQRDRGDRTGNIGIPLTNGLQIPGGAKRLSDDDFGGSSQFDKAQLDRVTEESPSPVAMIHAQSTNQLTEIDDVQFQRSMSLPRGFGGQRSQPGIHQGPVLPPPRSDSMNALRNMMVRRQRVRDGSSDSTLSPHTESPNSESHLQATMTSSPNYSTSPPYSPSNRNYSPVRSNSRIGVGIGGGGSISASSSSLYSGQHLSVPSQYHQNRYMVGGSTATSANNQSLISGPASPVAISPPTAHERLFGSAASINSLHDSPQLSPVFKSEAAKQIIKEMAEKKSDSPRRRPVPKEKRRHYTVSSSKPILDIEDAFSKMGMGRARDDLDMERALRPRINAPDVVRSTLSHKELKYNESTIDNLLGTPNKIFIPERYIPEQTPELSAEEQEHRLKKAESIRKMLSETTVTTAETVEDDVDDQKTNTLKKKVAEEKRQREHILQLNQILAKQVMEKSKMVAVQALATLPLTSEPSFEEDDLSPVTPLPLYQQRENFYS